MTVLEFAPSMPHLLETLLDAVFLIALLTPGFFLLIYTPLKRHLDQEARDNRRIKESGERFETVLRTAMDGFCVADFTGHFLDVNDAFCRMTGYSREELLGMSVLDVDVFLTAETFADRVREGAKKGHDHLESRMRRKDGTLVDLEINVTFSPSHPEEIFTFIRDITDRKKTQEKLEAKVRERTGDLRSALEKLHMETTALHAAANSVFITDAKGHIEWVNAAFTELTGYTPEEAIGNTPRLLKSGNHSLADYKNLWQTILSGRVWHGELVNKRKDGSLYPHETTITPVRGMDGRIAHFIAVSQNIFERKNLELRKDQFITVVSHELRTPIAVVAEGILQLQDGLRGPTTESQRHLLGIMASNTRRFGRVLNNLLRIGELTSGDARLNPRRFDMEELIQGVAAGFEKLACEKDLRMRLVLPEGPIPLVADPDKLKEVLDNLLDNAVKFTRKGEIAISLEKKPGEVECTVSDTGRGFSAEELPRVFKKFEQFSREYGPGPMGTGLGLSICKEIIDLHHGRIRVESKADEGSRFIFTLPAQAA